MIRLALEKPGGFITLVLLGDYLLLSGRIKG